MSASTAPLEFKIATERAELEQLHRLNYRTFVEEIPQHPVNTDRALVDRFLSTSTYFICKRGDRVIGMISLNERRPFSIDEKLPNLDRYLPPGNRVCEVRLLAVEREHRNGVVFRGLLRALVRHCVLKGINLAVISGTVRQLKLYQHMGFIPFGPLVGTANASYQPMYLTLDEFRRSASAVENGDGGEVSALRFLPGPVDMHPDVLAALMSPSVSHRQSAFVDMLRETQRLLCDLTRARHVEIVVGTGTLANDMVAVQLAALDQPGIILSNGEFGERLIDHATRARLSFATERLPLGASFAGEALVRAIARHPDARWCWMVHHETSTGALNDLTVASAICEARRLKLCVDCISSIGVVPVCLRAAHLATGVSGKGLGSVAGLALVFHRGEIARATRSPRYLDLSLYESADGVPFTHPSSLLSALRAATERTVARGDFGDVRELAAWTRRRLLGLGLRPLADEAVACPGIITLAFDAPDGAERLGDELARSGLEVSYRSDYLRKHNWLQIALMGECSRQKVRLLLRALQEQISSAA